MGFKGKKVAIVGVGIEGMSSLEYLSKKEADIFLLDKKTEEEIDKEKLKKAKALGAKHIFGENYLKDASSYDYIFRSPFVRPDLPQLKNAAQAGTKITSQTKLFFDLCKSKIVGVTGTKGKGTTSALIYEILKKSGKKVFFGGNIGNPSLDFLDEATPDSIAILELSSFQLMDLQKSPHTAVVLMTTSEHQDWHKDHGEYINAKNNIVKYQSKNDFVVYNSDYLISLEIGQTSPAEKFEISTKNQASSGAFVDQGKIVLKKNDIEQIVETKNVKLPGEHNLQNIAAAATVANILGVKIEIIQAAISDYRGLSHRLEFVEKIEGVSFYNDSASTIPETAIAAINSFKNPKVLILGGSSKNSDFSFLAKQIARKNVKAVILIGQESTTIKESIEKAGSFSGDIVEGLKSMEEIVEKARHLAKSGDVVILSPACASFGMFDNYKDRGEQFKHSIKKLKS